MPQGGTGGTPRKKPPAGPPPRPPVTRTTTTSHAASKGAYDLGKFSAGAVAEAEQEASDFAGWLGWPTWFNVEAMVKNLLQLGMQADPQAAYEFFWAQLKPNQQQANINAYFGLTKQQYTQQLNNLNDQYYALTGDTGVPDALRNRALKENWTQSELQVALQADPAVGASSPWVAVGLSYRDIQSQFGSVYGQAPRTKDQLTSWWKFRTGAQSVGGGGVAQQTFAPPQPLVARPLTSDVEVR